MLRSQAQWRCEVLVVGLMFAIGCGPQSRITTPVRSGPSASADKTVLLKYADSLEYWNRLGAADWRPVNPEGVLAKIEPEVDAYRISEPELDSGRVVARISKTGTGVLRRFALGEADTVSYWMVFKKDSQYYGHFFSQSADTTYLIKVDWHDGRANGDQPGEPMKTELPWGQSIAQWRYIPNWEGGSPEARYAALVDGTGGWVSCAAFGCCKTH